MNRYTMLRSRPHRRFRILPFLLALYLIVMSTGFPAVSARSYKTLEYGDSQSWAIAPPDSGNRFRKWDIITVDVNVTSGGPIDVYFMKTSEYDKLQANESFKTVVSKQGVNKTSFEWKKDDDEDEYYVLAIDNRDNARSNDAIPTSDIEYNFETEVDERHQQVILRMIWLSGAAVGVLIVVAAYIWIRRIRR